MPVAEARSSDICSVTTWDSTGRILNEGDTIGGDGSVNVLFRVEDDAFGYVNDFLDGPAQEVIQPLIDEIASLNGQLADLVSSSDWVRLGLPSYGESTTSLAIGVDLLAVRSNPDYGDTASANYEDLHAASDLLSQARQIVDQKETDEENLKEIQNAENGFVDVDLVRLDSQTGSARLTAHAEVTGFTWVKPAVGRVPVNSPAESQYVDHMFPEWFTDSGGRDLDSISAWLTQIAGVPAPVSDASSVCGTAADDGWGYVELTCQDPGSFRVDIIPHDTWDNSGMAFGSRGLVCPGAVDTATISVAPGYPANPNTSRFVILVTTYDADDKNLDGVEVRFTTDRCAFVNPLAGATYDTGMTPVDGGQAVTLWSDSDTIADANFLSDNPLQKGAGTVELALDCPTGTSGLASITAIVPRNGADIVLKGTINVVGPAAPSGLTLTLAPASVVCGQPLQATVDASDSNGNPVIDGTTVHFTTDSSSAIIGGQEGGQGENTTVGGRTTVSIAMSPTDPGPHTVIAWIESPGGSLLTQSVQQMECTQAAVAGEAPSGAAQGSNSITPPNTGDGGLADLGGSKSRLNQIALIAVVVGASAVFSSIRLRRFSPARQQRSSPQSTTSGNVTGPSPRDRSP